MGHDANHKSNVLGGPMGIQASVARKAPRPYERNPTMNPAEPVFQHSSTPPLQYSGPWTFGLRVARSSRSPREAQAAGGFQGRHLHGLAGHHLFVNGLDGLAIALAAEEAVGFVPRGVAKAPRQVLK